jgi:hypothetical protein
MFSYVSFSLDSSAESLCQIPAGICTFQTDYQTAEIIVCITAAHRHQTLRNVHGQVRRMDFADV